MCLRKKREGLKREKRKGGKEKKCSEDESCDVCLAILIVCSHVCMQCQRSDDVRLFFLTLSLLITFYSHKLDSAKAKPATPFPSFVKG